MIKSTWVLRNMLEKFYFIFFFLCRAFLKGNATHRFLLRCRQPLAPYQQELLCKACWASERITLLWTVCPRMTTLCCRWFFSPLIITVLVEFKKKWLLIPGFFFSFFLHWDSLWVSLSPSGPAASQMLKRRVGMTSVGSLLKAKCRKSSSKLEMVMAWESRCCWGHSVTYLGKSFLLSEPLSLFLRIGHHNP